MSVARFTRERVILLAAHFFFFLNFSELILLPKYFAHLGLHPFRIGILMGSFSLSVLLALPVAGLVSERMPRKFLFIAGAALMAFPSALYMGLHDSFNALVLLRILQGAGFSCTFGIIGAMVSRGADARERKHLLGILTVVGISTHALGPALGEHMIGRYGFGLFFSSAAAFGLAAFAAGFLLPHETAGQAVNRDGFHAPGDITALSVILGVIFGSAVIFLPLHLAGVGVNDSSLFFIPFVMGSFLMWTLLHRFIRTWSDTAAMIVSSALIALPLACMAWAGGVFALMAMSLAFGVGYGYLYPALNAALIDANPASQGRANAMFVWSFNLGMLGASLGFGYVSEITGYAGAFAGLAFLGFACMAAAIFRGKVIAR